MGFELVPPIASASAPKTERIETSVAAHRFGGCHFLPRVFAGRFEAVSKKVVST